MDTFGLRGNQRTFRSWAGTTASQCVFSARARQQSRHLLVTLNTVRVKSSQSHLPVAYLPVGHDRLGNFSPALDHTVLSLLLSYADHHASGFVPLSLLRQALPRLNDLLAIGAVLQREFHDHFEHPCRLEILDLRSGVSQEKQEAMPSANEAAELVAGDSCHEPVNRCSMHVLQAVNTLGHLGKVRVDFALHRRVVLLLGDLGHVVEGGLAVVLHLLQIVLDGVKVELNQLWLLVDAVIPSYP